jgi:hypothetical protein
VRLAVAIAVIAVAFSAAVYIHQRHTWTSTITSVQTKTGGFVTGTDTFTRVRHHPSWEDPAAALIAIGGIAVAAGIVTFRRPYFAKPS